MQWKIGDFIKKNKIELHMTLAHSLKIKLMTPSYVSLRIKQLLSETFFRIFIFFEIFVWND